MSDWVKRECQLIGHVATPTKREIMLELMLVLHLTVTDAIKSYNFNFDLQSPCETLEHLSDVYIYNTLLENMK
jgi:hypothetical protein